MDFEVQFIAAIIVGIIGLIFAGIVASRILKEDEGNEQVKFIGKAMKVHQQLISIYSADCQNDIDQVSITKYF